MLYKLMLAASLLVACQQKTDWPRATKLISDHQGNVMINVSNGAAFGRILQMRINGR